MSPDFSRTSFKFFEIAFFCHASVIGVKWSVDSKWFLAESEAKTRIAEENMHLLSIFIRVIVSSCKR